MADASRIGPPAVETGDEPPARRVVSPGGWRRALVAFVLGVAVGALVALVTPREGGPRRTVVGREKDSPLQES
ncbi:MAG: hypothetical protein ABR592_01695 [Nitriliruptorales bacterium]